VKSSSAADSHCATGGRSHEHAAARLPIAVVTVVVACVLDSFSALLNAVMNERRAALPAGDVSVAKSVLSRPR